MAKIPRYGPRRAVPEVTAGERSIGLTLAPMRRASAATFSAIGDMLGAAQNFIAPAVAKDRESAGERQALDDARGGRFRKRNPYTVRDKAYNEAARRVVSAKANTAFSSAVGDEIKAATSPDDLWSRLMGLVTASMANLGEGFEDVEAGLMASAASLFESSKGRFGDVGPIVSKDRVAAGEVLAAAERVAGVVAEPGMDASAAEGIPATVLDMLAAYGPPEAFAVGEKELPEDKSRPGILTAEEIGVALERVSSRLVDAQAGETVRNAAIVQQVIDEVTANRTGMPPKMRDAVLAAAIEEQNARNVARREAEAATSRAVSRLSGRPIPLDLSLPDVLPPSVRAEVVAGQRASELLAEITALPIPAQEAEVERRLALLNEAPDAPAVASTVLMLKRIAETAASGALADDPAIREELTAIEAEWGEGRARWGQQATAMLAALADGVPTTAEEMAALEEKARRLAAEGEGHAIEAGVPALVDRTAYDIVTADLARRNVPGAVAVARSMGSDIPELVFDDYGQLAISLASRSTAMSDARDRLGIFTGRDVDDWEMEAVATALQSGTMEERARVLTALGALPDDERGRMSKAFSGTFPAVAAAISAAAVSVPHAARLVDDVPPSSADVAMVTDLAGEGAGETAAALSSAGFTNPELAVLEHGAIPAVRDAVRDKLPPEDVDAELSPEQARRLRAMSVVPEDMTDADLLALRVLSSKDVEALAGAVRFVPDTADAVASFASLADRLEALPVEERQAFIASAREERRQAEIAAMSRPLFYDGDEITTEGLRLAANRIIAARRNGSITDDQYNVQAKLIRDLLGELGYGG